MPQDNNQAKILLVDDTPGNLDVMLEHLGNHQFNISVALNGYEAIELAQSVVPDIILMDVMMPGIDGFETCKILKANEITKNIPLIFMTALSDAENVVKGFEVGGVDYVTKPLQYQEVLARLKAHLTIRQQQLKLEKINQELLDKNELITAQSHRLEQMARTDPLTGLGNRRDFLERLEQEQAASIRTGKMFSVVLADIDHFKDFNDKYGHECGDNVLVTIATTLQKLLRKQDSVARWGGEEFVILLRETTAEHAYTLIERLRKEVENINTFCGLESTPLKATVTFGICQYQDDLSLNDCLNLADSALYLGKSQGRNQVVLARR